MITFLLQGPGIKKFTKAYPFYSSSIQILVSVLKANVLGSWCRFHHCICVRFLTNMSGMPMREVSFISRKQPAYTTNRHVLLTITNYL